MEQQQSTIDLVDLITNYLAYQLTGQKINFISFSLKK